MGLANFLGEPPDCNREPAPALGPAGAASVPVYATEKPLLENDDGVETATPFCTIVMSHRVDWSPVAPRLLNGTGAEHSPPLIAQ